jgi:hypothetical protein
MIELWLPSGKLTVCYGKLSFIYDITIKYGDFQQLDTYTEPLLTHC